MKQMLVLGVAVLTSWAIPASAVDSVAQEKWEAAKVLFEDRTNPAKVDAAIAELKGAVREAESSELKYDVLVFYSQVLYWKGLHVSTDDEKKAIHDEGRNLADAALQEEDYAEAAYWSAAHLGRWAEAKGVIASLSKKGLMIDTLESVFEKDTREFEAGETYMGYGADRILGRLYYKLPGFAGGSTRKALKHLSAAYEKAPEYPLNVIYYAEVLYSGSKADQAKAKRILDELLAKDPETLVPGRAPEATEEFEQARTLRKEMGA